MPIYWYLGKVLDEKGITPLELARTLRVKHPSIYRLAGQRKITRITSAKLSKLCDALDCEPGDLLKRRPK